MGSTNLSLCILAALSSLLTAYGQSVSVWKSGQIRWQEINSDGSKYAVLEGDRSKPGPFTYAFWLPNGVWERPHMHTGTARVTVVSGTLLLGEGRVLRKNSAEALTSGSVFVVPANVPHWEGARGDTLIVGVGTGPWITKDVDQP